MVRAIDCWVNVTMGEQKLPDYLIRVKEDTFEGGDEFFRNLEPDALLERMDRAGVDKAVIKIDTSRPFTRAPKYLPPELIHDVNTRGQDKILFAPDHPVLSFERCIREAEGLDLREGVLDKYLYANAERLFFAPRNAPPAPQAAALRRTQ